MRRLLLMAAFSAVVACQGAQVDGPAYALVVVRGGLPAAPVVAPVNFTEAARALGISGPAASTVAAAEELPDGSLRPVLSQFDPEPDYDASTHAAGTVSLALPPGPQGPRRVRVYFQGAPPGLPAPLAAAEGQGLEVTQEGGRITVAGPDYRFTHDPAKLAGLPSRIEWVGSGKVFDSFSLNDRVYDPSVAGFSLRDDTAPRIQVIARGPVRAVVRVTARYMRGTEQPASKPSATYEFSYFAGSPLVRVTAHIMQQSAKQWNELHFLEVNFPDQSFTHWVCGDPFAEGEFKATKTSVGEGSWGALVEGKSILGLLGCGARFYDGRGEYGTYLHGPWVSWGETTRDFEGYLWVTTGSVAQVRAAAATVHAGVDAAVTTAPFEERLREVRAETAKMPPGPRRGRFTWVADQVERLATVRGELVEAWGMLQRLGAAAGAGGDALTAVPWQLKTMPRGAWEQRGPVLVDDGRLGLGLLRTDSGVALFSLYDLHAERELLTGVPVGFWSAECAAGAGRLTLSSASGWGQVKAALRSPGGSRPTLVLEFRRPQQEAAEGVWARVQVAFDGPATRWKLTVENASRTLSLRDVFMPRLELGPIGPSAEDDAVVFPRGSGEIAFAPLVRGFGGFSGRYPSGWASMQFMSHYDPDCGLYVASHDPVACSKDLQISRGDKGLAVQVQWYAPDCGVPGNRFVQSGETAIQLFKGDWFDATQIYKDWVSHHAKWWPQDRDRGDTPGWMRDLPVWAQMGGGPTEVVPATKRFAEYMGLPTGLHWYSWHQIPFDVNYPHYFPVKPGFKEGVAELQAAGVRVMPYINGRLWDSALADFKSEGIKGAAKQEDGSNYIEEYGSGAKLAPMCPTTRVWRDKVQAIVLRLVGEYGVDGVYIDQVAAAAPALCFDRTHGHPLGGGSWWTEGGYWPLLTELRHKIRQQGLVKFLTTECNGEPYIHCFDGYLTWHFQYQNQIPMFASVYAGRIQPFSRAYGGDEVAQCMKAGQQLVFGEQLGWCDPGVVTERPKFAAYLRQCARLRYALRDCLARGDMARPPTLRGEIPTVTADWRWSGTWPVTTDALLAGAWRSEGGKLAVIFANVIEQPVKARWEFDGTQYGFDAAARLKLTRRTEGGLGEPESVGARFSRDLEVPGRTVWAFEVEG